MVIAVLAARFALGLPPWLPARLLAVKLPPRFFPRRAGGGEQVHRRIERQLRPRWLWLTETVFLQRLHTGIVCAGALLLLLPLGGIPFTNTLPALVVVIGTLGVMERDAWQWRGVWVSGDDGVYFTVFAGVIIELGQRVALAGVLNEACVEKVCRSARARWSVTNMSTSPLPHGLSEIGQIAITVGDVTKATAFYRDVLGLKFLFAAGPNLAFLAAGSVRHHAHNPAGRWKRREEFPFIFQGHGHRRSTRGHRGARCGE